MQMLLPSLKGKLLVVNLFEISILVEVFIVDNKTLDDNDK
jgi:hypothetical protein